MGDVMVTTMAAVEAELERERIAEARDAATEIPRTPPAVMPTEPLVPDLTAARMRIWGRIKPRRGWAGMDVTRCRSCGMPIVWSYGDSGKRMPFDVEIIGTEGSEGWVIEEGRPARPVEPLFDVGVPRYRPHWATCPHASEWRGGK